MILAQLFSKLKLAPQDAEVIFDRDEPVGRPTDLVMPRRRWFGRNKAHRDRSGVASSSAGAVRQVR
jgi:hypothetical protein